jgi:hypothetical protein
LILRFFAKLVQPIWRAVIRKIPIEDPWERINTAPELHMYGAGARLNFEEYLRGDSTVKVASLAEVQDWLLGCAYQSDEALFAESDFWQHPVTFERLRAGDCEDFALWAWRKLIELGYDVDFIAGYRLDEGALDDRHAWLLVRMEGDEHVFEPTTRTREGMILPLAAVRDQYLPEFGADRTGKRFAFVGYFLGEQKRLRRQAIIQAFGITIRGRDETQTRSVHDVAGVHSANVVAQI